jgi:NAD+ kinase
MHIAFVAKSEEKLETVRRLFEQKGLVTQNPPDVVVVIGGDGTLLRAEREYPGVPKALVKDSEVGHLYHSHSPEELAAALQAKRFSIDERSALEATVHHVTYRAANDVIIRNRLLTHAIRFTLTIDGKPVGKEFIGDGLVVATPMGSTAYYHTITRKSFSKGFGIALNNIIQHTDLPLLTEETQITVTITRGPVDLGVDNSMHVEPLKEGDEIVIKKSSIPVRIVCL